MNHANAAAHPMQRRTPHWRTSSGFAITIETARPFYVRLCADETWFWTANRSEAELFPSEERAAAWAARNIGGGEPRVVGVML